MKSDLFGILNINKPKGLTSFDVVARLRKILKIKQIGHSGTLDPLAQGVLPVCVGNATRLIEYFESKKTYRASMLLGVTSDTYDLEGTELSRCEVVLNEAKLREVMNRYLGEITQTPPIYSAVHLNGKRLYEYARQNIEVKDIPTRKVVINSLEIKEIKTDSSNPVVVFDVECSGGTYIRSLISDIGKDLGCGALMSDLVRLKACGFDIQDSLTLEEVQKSFQNGSLQFVDPCDGVLLKTYSLDKESAQKVIYGQSLCNKDFDEGQMLKLVYNKRFAGIAKVSDNRVLPKKVFISQEDLKL